MFRKEKRVFEREEDTLFCIPFGGIRNNPILLQ